MEYTLGTAHAALTDTGELVVDKPAGLLLEVTTIPAGATAWYGVPMAYRGLGGIVAGDPNGWHPRLELVYADQLVVPLPDGITRVGYNLADGVDLTVHELVGVPSLKGLDPWDRNPTLYNTTVQANDAGSTASVNGYTYTVPTGKWLLVSTLKLRLRRTAVATTQGLNQPRSTVAFTSVSTIILDLMGNAIGDVLVGELPNPVYLPAGAVIDWTHGGGADTGGTTNHRISITGLLFDA